MTPIERAVLYLLDRQRTEIYGELMPEAEELIRQITQAVNDTAFALR